MKITKAQLKKLIKEELEKTMGEGRDLAATDFELYGQLLDLTKNLQEFKDNLDYAMGLTAASIKQSQLSDKVYEMIRKASFDLDTARTKFAQEIGQDPAPELKPVRDNL